MGMAMEQAHDFAAERAWPRNVCWSKRNEPIAQTSGCRRMPVTSAMRLSSDAKRFNWSGRVAEDLKHRYASTKTQQGRGAIQ